MKLTKEQLRELIKEELKSLEEAHPLSTLAKTFGVKRGDPSYPSELEGGESDPLRDAVRDFVDAVKDLV